MHNETLGESVPELKEAAWERLLDLYETDPDLIEDELRGLIEAYLGAIDDPYGD